tara:strand:- start:374 stop:550 length:177 start_codon:yes stop_codon:yes gene_type:complete
MEEKKDKEIEALRDCIWVIADIIHMQLPLRYQDKWLENVIENGLFDPHEDEEEGDIKG